MKKMTIAVKVNKTLPIPYKVSSTTQNIQNIMQDTLLC